jgi:hypothetical protein
MLGTTRKSLLCALAFPFTNFILFLEFNYLPFGNPIGHEIREAKG